MSVTPSPVEATQRLRALTAALPFAYARYRYLRWRWKRDAATRARLWAAPRRDGLVMDVDERDVIDFMLLHFGVWEPDLTEIIAAHLKPGDAAADFGANIGAHTLTMAHAVGAKGCVLAVEPAPDTHARLAANVARNALTQVMLVQKAAAETHGTITLFDGEDNSRGRATIAPIHEGRARRAEVEMIPAAEAWSAERWARTRLIKIDVERAEDRVLRGLVPMMALPPTDCVWVIECEPQALRARGTSLSQLLAPRLALGAQFYRLENSANLKAMMAPRAAKLAPVDPERLALADASDFVVAAPDVVGRWT
jgi:FkbM family methyltransferase